MNEVGKELGTKDLPSIENNRKNGTTIFKHKSKELEQLGGAKDCAIYLTTWLPYYLGLILTATSLLFRALQGHKMNLCCVAQCTQGKIIVREQKFCAWSPIIKTETALVAQW